MAERWRPSQREKDELTRLEIKRKGERLMKEAAAKAARDARREMSEMSTARGMDVSKARRRAAANARSNAIEDEKVARDQSAEWERTRGFALETQKRMAKKQFHDALATAPGRRNAIPQEFNYARAARSGYLEEYIRVHGKGLSFSRAEQIGTLKRIQASAPEGWQKRMAQSEVDAAIKSARAGKSSRRAFLRGHERLKPGQLSHAEQRAAEAVAHMDIGHLIGHTGKAKLQAAGAAAARKAGMKELPSGKPHPRAATLKRMQESLGEHMGRGAMRDWAGQTPVPGIGHSGGAVTRYFIDPERLSLHHAAVLAGVDPHDKHGAMEAKRKLTENAVRVGHGKLGVPITHQNRHVAGILPKGAVRPYVAVPVHGVDISTVWMPGHIANRYRAQSSERWSHELQKAIGWSRVHSDEQMIRAIKSKMPRFSAKHYMSDLVKKRMPAMSSEMSTRMRKAIYGTSRIKRMTLPLLHGEERIRKDWSLPMGKGHGYGYGVAAVQRATTASAALQAGKTAASSIDPSAPIIYSELGFVADINAMPRIQAAIPRILTAAVEAAAQSLWVAAHQVWAEGGISPQWQPLSKATKMREGREGVVGRPYYETGLLLSQLKVKPMSGDLPTGGIAGMDVGFFDDVHPLGHGMGGMESSTAAQLAFVNEFGGFVPSGFKGKGHEGGVVQIPARPWLSQAADLFGPRILDQMDLWIGEQLVKKGVQAKDITMFTAKPLASAANQAFINTPIAAFDPSAIVPAARGGLPGEEFPSID